MTDTSHEDGLGWSLLWLISDESAFGSETEKALEISVIFAENILFPSQLQFFGLLTAKEISKKLSQLCNLWRF